MEIDRKRKRKIEKEQHTHTHRRTNSSITLKPGTKERESRHDYETFILQTLL